MLRELKPCDLNRSMPCVQSGPCRIQDERLIEILKLYFSTLPLKSVNLDPESVSSDYKHAKEHALIKRADVSVCIQSEEDEQIIKRYLDIGRISRKACNAFKAFGDEFYFRLRAWRRENESEQQIIAAE